MGLINVWPIARVDIANIGYKCIKVDSYLTSPPPPLIFDAVAQFYHGLWEN